MNLSNRKEKKQTPLHLLRWTWRAKAHPETRHQVMRALYIHTTMSQREEKEEEEEEEEILVLAV